MNQVSLKKEIHAIESELLSAPWHTKIYELENEKQALSKELRFIEAENDKSKKVRNFEEDCLRQEIWQQNEGKKMDSEFLAQRKLLDRQHRDITKVINDGRKKVDSNNIEAEKT